MGLGYFLVLFYTSVHCAIQTHHWLITRRITTALQPEAYWTSYAACVYIRDLITLQVSFLVNL